MTTASSALTLFQIGIGPSSSHTVGPMKIAAMFLDDLEEFGLIDRVEAIRVTLHGSLALTGAGHGTLGAVLAGLAGCVPHDIDAKHIADVVQRCESSRQLRLRSGKTIPFDQRFAFEFSPKVPKDAHPNTIDLEAYDPGGGELLRQRFYSTGGGFVARANETGAQFQAESPRPALPHPFDTAADMLSQCARNGWSIAELLLANEPACERDAIRTKIKLISQTMMRCIDRGLATDGLLPGSMGVRRRARALWQRLYGQSAGQEPERLFDELNAYALAVNEENAAGNQVVTAPTNGAAGIVPSLLRHYCYDEDHGLKLEQTSAFLLTAGAIGTLYKSRASISGAEMGCQGEVGVACSMAAAGLTAVWGGTPQQCAVAAEIGMEHNLGLTCDPVGGLVQIPCIERNALGAVKAVNAARLAMQNEGPGLVSLDQVIATMRQTGLDMSSKYKETSLGGLAVNVVEC